MPERSSATPSHDEHGPAGALLAAALLKAAPPPFVADWRALQPEDSRAVLRSLKRALIGQSQGEAWPTDAPRIALRGYKLTCYPETLLIDAVVENDGVIGHAGLLVHDGQVHPLSTQSYDLHDFNDQVPPCLDGDAARIDYLRFFCWTVCGDDGPFQIVEEPGSHVLDGCDEQTRRLIAEAIVPPQVEGTIRSDNQAQSAEGSGQEARDRHLLGAVVLYSGTLFSARFALAASGEIEMISDEPVVEISSEAARWKVNPYVKYRLQGGRPDAA